MNVTNPHPTVSIVIPTYKHQKYVVQTLESVFAQTYTDYEIIVVNDGSPDDTARILRPLAEAGRITYIEQENQGVAAARNRGISAARGRFIALIDDDDLVLPDKLAWQAAILEGNPDVAVAYGTLDFIDEANESIIPRDDTGAVVPYAQGGPTGDVHALFCQQNWIISPGQTLLRRDALPDPVCDPALWGTDDWDLWLRLAEAHRFHFEARVALHYRYHPHNASRDSLRLAVHTNLVYEKHLERNRQHRARLSVLQTEAARWRSDARGHFLHLAWLDYHARQMRPMWDKLRFIRGLEARNWLRREVQRLLIVGSLRSLREMGRRGTARNPQGRLRRQLTSGTTGHCIAFISTLDAAPWGGSEVLWSQTALRLRKEGHLIACNVVWWQEAARPIRDLEVAGAHLHYRNQPGNRALSVTITALRQHLLNRLRRLRHPGTVGELPAYRHLLYLESIREWLRSLQPDLVIVSQGHYTEGAEWRWLCREQEIPTVSVVHAVSTLGWLPDSAIENLAGSYRQSKVVYFVSEQNRRLTENILATTFTNSRIVRNPFPVDLDTPPYPADVETVRLACVARLESVQKGQDILLEVLARDCWRMRPLHVTFYGTGPNRMALERLSERYQLERVTFAGHIDDINEMWKQHHALILPSRFEGLPLVLVEAMLCGRPAIVTDVGGNRELIEDGVTGFIAPAPTADLLNDAMERAWQQRHRWKIMGEAAAERVRCVMPADPIGVFIEELRPLWEAK